jgi:aspartyl-tRNA(Asn)/glutamyl-tRNA(Gln) amidotransferase subunit A
VASLENFDYADMEDEIKSGYEETTRLLQNLGVSIGQARLSDYDPSSARRAGLLVSEVEACVLLEDFRLKSQEAFSPELQTMLDFGRRAPASRYFNAIQRTQTLKRQLCSIFQKQKFVITPTTPQTPFPFSKDTPINQADFTALANFCGCPAISLPLKRSGEEKPVGLQIMAGPGSDIDLLSFALGIEKLISNN